MPAIKRIADLNDYKSILPYASELFGVYQPLLGWKSKRTVRRLLPGMFDSQMKIVDALLSAMSPSVAVKINDFTNDGVFFDISELQMGSLSVANRARVPGPYRYFITEVIAEQIAKSGLSKDDPEIWRKFVSAEALRELLPMAEELMERDHTAFVLRAIPFGEREKFNFANNRQRVSEIVRRRAEAESAMAGTLNELFERGQFDVLSKLFFPEDKVVDTQQLDAISAFVDPLESFDPKADIGRVTLSPIGIVHLFRQYFFEFDTFLGAPVEHIWLSPGSSLELLEINTRRQLVERSLESVFETITKRASASSSEDEISNAVREENQSNTKFGASVSAGGSVSGGAPGVYTATGHLDATTSYSLEGNQKNAKETTDRHMKQQSSSLSSEIRKNFKTTFKTTTEREDVSSKRHTLQNSTGKLINYELRRKMRQVGVQVQDIGTSLCWQTYVDLPGSSLGLANLVHIAEPPDLASLPHPEQGALPAPITKDYTAKLFFKIWWGDNDTVETYTEHGPLDDKGGANADFEGDFIHMNYDDYRVEPVPGYVLHQVVYESCLDGKFVDPVFFNVTSSSFSIHLRKVNFAGDSLTLKLKLIYVPDDDTKKALQAKYTAELATYNTENARRTKEAYVKAARDRIKVASNVQPRKFDELREEERTIVYRALIGDLLNVGVDLSHPKTRHIMAELIGSMFEVDKMLYFTAPEWWMPRAHTKSAQNVTGKEGEAFVGDDIVSWGGAGANYRPNYYITEDSLPAKLGSSLGWLLQLDGDNIRNAFLNAPWVKAVIPIRPGKELAALNWLTRADVEGVDGINARYQEGSEQELVDIIRFLEEYPFDPTDPRKARYENFSQKVQDDPETTFVTIQDALICLALRIKAKHEASHQLVSEEIDGEEARYLPTDKVFERGFDPLEGGFQAVTEEQFAVSSQWVEVLPTDQIVAVEVSYDPKTGRQL